jgi:hypothetical protein
MRKLAMTILLFCSMVLGLYSFETLPPEYAIDDCGDMVIIGSSIKQSALSKLGKIEEREFVSEYLSGKYWKVWHPGLSVIYELKSEKIYMVTITNNHFKTSRGISVGDSEKDVIKKYGVGKKEKGIDETYALSYSMPFGNEENVSISFRIKKGTIIGISLFPGYN